MENKSIILISCDHFNKELVDTIMIDIAREFKRPVLFKKFDFDISNYYSPSRRQYDANRLLKVVSELSYPDTCKKIGLYRVDLFIPILTYIFGQAILNGNAAVVSFFRLRNEHYGMEKNNTIRNMRLRKVILHEIGHMFGLIHCHNPICIMRSSTYVEDIDQKEMLFCAKCRKELNQSLVR